MLSSSSSHVPRPIKRQIFSNERQYQILNSPVSINSSVRSEKTPRNGRSDKIVSPSVVILKQSKLHTVSSQKSTWLTKKCLVRSLVIACALAIIATVVTIAVIFTRPHGSDNATTSTSYNVTSAYWSFDNTTQDLYGVYNGVLINGATYYTSPASTNAATPYFGVGASLYLQSSLNQSVLINSTFFNFSYTSWTVEAWIYPTAVGGDDDILGQCESSVGTNLCLYLILRGSRMFMGFSPNYLSGTTVLSSNVWHHLAYVYNYQTQQQILYLDGVQDAIQSNVSPYQGQNGSITIGTSAILSSSSFFNGYIDNVALTTRAKSATEILADGTLSFYFSFDNPTPSLDNGPNGLNCTISNGATVSGRVNQAIRLNGASSYVQLYGFYQWGFISAKPFSVAMWINPISTYGGTLLHFSSTSTGSSCLSLMGITLGGQIIVQAYYSNNPSIVGPQLSTNTWTHIGYTYSTTNGMILYYNGAAYLTLAVSSFYNNGYIDYLNFGSNLGCCGCANVPNYAFQGSLDELYVYRREISASEMLALANP
ncbi:unnamed protein product [Didymodactylos carnosus]|uniref:LamG-like jellyroll fold domain-containing protein n=1 Tax=Didymodactylos carnosus TaxID=1234261 RepID=A0A814I722_9BILA|nr:unnamed protein product [Didymodactylos carnosus]CAF1227091.1 unnamed protein product [Didymodactylos carnosus]CAF3791054.1 unnamed protein product [Didymodactylos carnosus]CAF4035167.1 unnamed protein product [Didymodactylos carnosus]